ncbi:MAG: hypothetical protein M0Q93_00825, partial [Terrimicrobiaceae bacterium]|nr:hypothetical protein [Terrimicrobiaceae bacterium]
MITTEGFRFSPGGGAQLSTAAPVPLSFVNGASLMPTSGVENFYAGKLAGIEGIASGIKVGVEGITDGVKDYVAAGLAQKKLDLEEAKYKEQMAFAREKLNQAITAGPKPLDALDQERLEALQIANEKARKGTEEWDPTRQEADFNAINEDLPTEQGLDPNGVNLFSAGVEDPLVQKPTLGTLNNVAPLSEVPSSGSPLGINLRDEQNLPVSADASLLSQPLATVSAPTAKEVPKEVAPLKDGEWRKAPQGYQTISAGHLQTWGIDSNGKPKLLASTKMEAPEGPSEELNAAQLKTWNTLADNVKQNQQITMARDAIGSYGIVSTNLATGNGLSDITAINAFQRMVDPGVAVREGDVSLIQQAIPRMQRWGLKAQNMVIGDQLSPEVRQQMMVAAQNMVKSRVSGAEEYVKDYREVAKRSG